MPELPLRVPRDKQSILGIKIGDDIPEHVTVEGVYVYSVPDNPAFLRRLLDVVKRRPSF
jgi:hypothetical protein